MVLSKLVKGKVSGRWLFVLAKRIDFPDGSFAGTVIGLFDVSYFDKLFAELKTSRKDTIELRDKDSNLIAFWPKSLKQSAQIGSRTVSQEIRNLIEKGSSDVTYKSVKAYNDLEQMVSLCKTDQYPFFVITGHAEYEYLRPWRNESVIALMIAAIFTLATILSAKILFKSRETELLQIESKRLAEENDRLESVIEGTQAGTWEWNVQTGEAILNERWAEIIGYSLKELSPISIDTWINNIHPDDLNSSNEMLQKHFNGETEYYDCEFRMKHKNGHWVSILDRGKVISRTDDGKPQWMFGTHIDITARKLAEVEWEKLQKKLNQAQKMESIGNLAGGIAHDFNNLLFPIIGMSELLLEDLPMESREWENVQEILRAGMRGRDLVKQILAFSRQSEHKMIPIRIQNVLDEAIKLSRATIPTSIEIYQDIQQDCGMVMADPSQIHQIGMNIITNAFHAIGNTGGKISVKLRQIALETSQALDINLSPGFYAVLSISDTGHGMSEDIIGKIFDPYFTTKEPGKGTGLGLSVVYGIINEHKGKIKVYSETGKGTTFDIYLPLIEQSDRTEAVTETKAYPGGNERILVVDDEKSVAALEASILTRLGYNVTFHVDSHKALGTFQADPNGFDLIITDMTMPDMTGDQLAIKILSIKPDMPIIICTGFSERIGKKQAENIGVSGFLMKPVMIADLAEMVRKVLDETQNT
ncbi:ATP-binding protein [uncultured Desulfobacter sp.]|uniref:ATP-binding protein n=1 Tax=uncultured Desulfobacter sp. TaxID=240139 RepID=UPI002AAB99C9|nr:ATP-binding protein [uncultured Desulfobacter sp.]